VIRDIKSFTKMFQLNIPHDDHFDYYIDQLSKTEKYKNIKRFRDEFIQLESERDDLYGFRMDKMQLVINFIKDSHPYMEMIHDKNLLDLPMNRNFSYSDGVNYISVDMVQANWNSLKKYDQFNYLGDSYKDLLLKFDFPGIFCESKSMRQYIFGNVNPRLQQKVERNIIQEIIREFSDDFQVERVQHDEVIFSFDKFEDLAPFKDLDSKRWRLKVFTVNRREDGKVKTIYDTDGVELYKELVGIPGNIFYMKNKEYITGEKLDIRDLYFKNDGRVGVWNVPQLKIKL